jgi:hypothetical protein
MFPTGGFTTLLSPDATQTAIDSVAWEEYMRELQPGYLSARDNFFYKQMTDDKIAHIWDEDSNVGAFQQTGEQEEILNSQTRIGNQKIARQQKWTKQVPISFEAFKTDQHGLRQKIGYQIGDRARLTQDKRTVLDTYGDAFAGLINTTPDGQPLSSNSHTTLTGANVDNLETGALSGPDNLWTLVQSLANQQAQDGEAGSQVMEGIVVPFILYKTAKEILGSPLIPMSGENNLNIFETDYGQVMIRASVYLNSAYNSNTNANTSYHIVSRNHMITRNVLADLNMTMIQPEMTANDTYAERARFMESHFPESWTAYAGSNGTTA